MVLLLFNLSVTLPGSTITVIVNAPCAVGMYANSKVVSSLVFSDSTVFVPTGTSPNFNTTSNAPTGGPSFFSVTEIVLFTLMVNEVGSSEVGLRYPYVLSSPSSSSSCVTVYSVVSVGHPEPDATILSTSPVLTSSVVSTS